MAECVGAFNVPCERIWNICMLAHVDHGKSALSDSLISSNGIISARSAGQVRYMDSRQDEQIRGITMKSSSIALGHRLKESGLLHVINLIDSPGHVDFSGEVEAALRIADGAVLVVDIVEGVCVQTVTVLRAALEQSLRPILVLNKMDRLFSELKLEPMDAYRHIVSILEQVNVIMGVREVEQMMSDAQITDDAEAEGEEGEWKLEDKSSAAISTESGYFSPELGNVVFASATDGWAFRLADFARLFSEKFGISETVLRRTLWGDYYLQSKTKRIMKRKGVEQRGNAKPMFVQFILNNIHSIYDTVLSTQHDHELAVQKRQVFVSKLRLKVTSRDVKHRDATTSLRAIMNAWLPASSCLLETVIEQLPNVRVSQANSDRLNSIWPHAHRNSSAREPSKPPDNDTNGMSSFQNQYQAISQCLVSANGPVIAYVAKMVDWEDSHSSNEMNVRKPKTRAEVAQLREGHSGPMGADKEESGMSGVCMIALARVLCGTLKVGDTVHVYSPKYAVAADGTYDSNTVSTATVSSLYLPMGRGMDSLKAVSAGAVVGIGGLEDVVLKTATISSEPPGICLPAGASPSPSLGLDKESVARVAVEPHLPIDLPKLQAGLRLLNQADPAVETYITAKGEHVVAAHGELHLERCLKDLRERYTKGIKIHVSKPIVSFRETVWGGVSPNVVPQKNEVISATTDVANSPMDSVESGCVQRPGEPAKDVSTRNTWGVKIELDGPANEIIDTAFLSHGRMIRVGDTSVSFRVTAAPLPPQVATALEDVSGRLRSLDVSSQIDVQTLASAKKQVGDALERFASETETKKQTKADILAFWQKNVLNNLWCAGPGLLGPNVLVGPTCGLPRTTPAHAIVGTDSEGSKLEIGLPKEVEQAIITGFQLGIKAGPLCEEPMYGVLIVVDRFQMCDLDALSSPDVFVSDDISAEGGDDAILNRSGGTLGVSGLIIGSMREAVRLALKHTNARLLEGVLHVDISVPGDVLGKTYTVIGQRRGRVLKEDMKDGVHVFGIEAFIPVQDSFGFTDLLRKQTSGFAVPQMTFSHWEAIELDPFWFPQTEEELEDLGAADSTAEQNNIARKLINGVRRRKGLRVDEKIVENAEKQRTLSRKK